MKSRRSLRVLAKHASEVQTLAKLNVKGSDQATKRGSENKVGLTCVVVIEFFSS